MRKKEIEEAKRKINTMLNSRNVVRAEIYDYLQKLFKRLKAENGIEETRDLRELILTNVINTCKINFGKVPSDFKKVSFMFADVLEEKEDYEGAKEVYEELLLECIITDKKLPEYYMAANKINKLKLKIGEQTPAETIEENNDLAKDAPPEADIKPIDNDYDLFLEAFTGEGEIESKDLDGHSVEEIFLIFKDRLKTYKGDIFADSPETEYVKPNDEQENEPGPKPPKLPKPPRPQKPLDKSLYPEERLKFLIENFRKDGWTARFGKEKSKGLVLFEVKGTDLVIAEQFLDEKGEIATGKATYILPKDLIFLLEDEKRKQSRSEIKRGAKEIKDTRVQTANHTTNYYNTLKSKFNIAQDTLRFPEVEDLTRKILREQGIETGKLYEQLFKEGEKQRKPRKKKEKNQIDEPEEKKEIPLEKMSIEQLANMVIKLREELNVLTQKYVEAIKEGQDLAQIEAEYKQKVAELTKVKEVLLKE